LVYGIGKKNAQKGKMSSIPAPAILFQDTHDFIYRDGLYHMTILPFHRGGCKQGIDDGFFRCFDGSHEQGYNIFIMQYGNSLYGTGRHIGYAYRIGGGKSDFANASMVRRSKRLHLTASN
jgi:hypothetical protein